MPLPTDLQPARSCQLADIHTCLPQPNHCCLGAIRGILSGSNQQHVTHCIPHDGTAQQAKLALGRLMNPPLALLPALPPASQAPQPPATSLSAPWRASCSSPCSCCSPQPPVLVRLAAGPAPAMIQADQAASGLGRCPASLPGCPRPPSPTSLQSAWKPIEGCSAVMACLDPADGCTGRPLSHRREAAARHAPPRARYPYPPPAHSSLPNPAERKLLQSNAQASGQATASSSGGTASASTVAQVSMRPAA